MAGRAPRRPRRELPGPGGPPRRFAIVAARFNEKITRRLLTGAQRALQAAGVPDEAVDVHWVPGSFELPQAAGLLARGGRYAGIVCVGCVIKGQTPHFDFVAGQAAAGIQRVALETGVPATFGVITALTEEQAWERAGGEVGNRGQEAADAAIEMAEFVQRLDGMSGTGAPSAGRRRRLLARSTADRRGRGALRSGPGGK
jgi:6,7-dimethyl-8-ribityllumazine synthase